MDHSLFHTSSWRVRACPSCHRVRGRYSTLRETEDCEFLFPVERSAANKCHRIIYMSQEEGKTVNVNFEVEPFHKIWPDLQKIKLNLKKLHKNSTHSPFLSNRWSGGLLSLLSLKLSPSSLLLPLVLSLWWTNYCRCSATRAAGCQMELKTNYW